MILDKDDGDDEEDVGHVASSGCRTKASTQAGSTMTSLSLAFFQET